MRVPLVILFLCYTVASSYAQVINVADFGARVNSFEDVTEAVWNAIMECKEKQGSVLEFPKGRYDFWPEKSQRRKCFISNTSSESECPSKIKNIALLFEGAKNLTIEGNGSTFVFHGKTIIFALDKCENIKVQNISFDFERPSMSELTLEELAPNQIIASIHPDSKYAIIDDRIKFYGEGWSMQENLFSIMSDTVEGTNLYSSLEPILNSRAIEIAPFKVRFEGDFSNTSYKEKEILSTRNHVRDHVGVFVNQSKNITFNNLNIHYMHGLGVVSQFSENLTYKKVNIVPSRGRSIAAFADGMHFSGCKGHIEVDSCKFRGLHDDPINVHGTYLRINKINSKQSLTMRFMHGQTYGMQPFFENDTIAFVQSSTLRKIDYAIVKRVKRVSDREFDIMLDKPIPNEIKEGDCLENITCSPSLRVSNCRVEMTNTRGLLITTPKKVVVENNYFFRTGMYAILIAGDANSWYESGAVNDVLIQNNIFDACGYNLYDDRNSYAIALEPENHEAVKEHKVHRNVRIENNIFKVYEDNLVLKARSAESLFFIGNMVEQTNFVPRFKNRTKSDNDNASFRFEDCTDVILKDNIFENPKVSVNCSKMQKKDIKQQNNMSTKFEIK